jgi:hypothetical protein
MMMYNIEFIRRVSGRDDLEVIEVHNMMAFGLEEVVQCAARSLRTITFRVPPESFRIRQNGNHIVYARPELSLGLVKPFKAD